MIPPEQVQKGFSSLISSIGDLVLDVPDAPELLSRFVLRAIVDDVLPPAVVTHIDAVRGRGLSHQPALIPFSSCCARCTTPPHRHPDSSSCSILNRHRHLHHSHAVTRQCPPGVLPRRQGPAAPLREPAGGAAQRGEGAALLGRGRWVGAQAPVQHVARTAVGVEQWHDAEAIRRGLLGCAGLKTPPQSVVLPAPFLSHACTALTRLYHRLFPALVVGIVTV